MDTVTWQKRHLRRRIRASRRDLVAAGSQTGLDRALVRVAQGPGPLAPLARPGATVAAYAAMPGEPDLARVRAWLAGAGCRVLLPVVTTLDDEPALAWAVDAGDLAPGDPTPAGARIQEPTGDRLTDPGPVDLVLLPALAVDQAGWRLGQGGGYYDRTIERLGWGGPQGPTLVAVVHDTEVLEEIPHEAHEVPVDAALTPSGWVRLGSL